MPSSRIVPGCGRLSLVIGTALLAAPATVRASEEVTVPVDVGVGPAAYVISGPLFHDQAVFTGLKISVAAIIGQETIRKYQGRIPQRFRQQALRMTEVRYSPSIFIPDSLLISPKVYNTGLYGITWRPISISVPLAGTPSGPNLRVSAGLLFTYAYIYSDVLPTTHFLRPGLDLAATIEIPVTSRFLISFGWSSGFYIPQELGGLGLGSAAKARSLDDVNRTLWHFGQAFLKFHARFPYRARF